ncbi:CBN-NCX-7 protein, partial [Aphelenchoides avenae]
MALLSDLHSQKETPESCEPFQQHELSSCNYVHKHSDMCEGGGYIPWTEVALCADGAGRVAIIVVAVLILLYLFLMITSAADEFSDNITLITENHQISQNIAGVTFMAFGNGAPDIFSTIASVLSTKHPKASLAIGELLGGGIFVTTVVVACVILNKPFRVMRRPFLRDTSFYLIALGWLVFMLLHDEHLHLWEPSIYMIFYVVYATVVVVARYFHQRQRRILHERKRSERLASRLARSRRDTQHGPPSRRVTIAELKPDALPAIEVSDADGDATPPKTNGIQQLAPNLAGES